MDVEALNVGAVSLPVVAAQRDPGSLDALGLERAYRDVVASLDGDGASHGVGDDLLVEAGALYHGGPVQWSFIPKVFSSRDVAHLAWIAETMGSIMEKVTARFAADASFRALFDLDPELERLAALPAPYAPAIPLARVDIFLDDETGDFKFCELNTDGSSGMLVTDAVTRANLATRSGSAFARGRDVRAFDVMGACADAVLAAYRASGGTADEPCVAAVDFPESIVPEEIRAFERVFAERGARLRFSDIRGLEYGPRGLTDAEGRIDCVWRRVVASEMLEKRCPGADALMRCAEDGRVPVVGGFATWPCATKTVFSVLSDPAAANLLDADEAAFVEAHVPRTHMLAPESDLSPFSERDRWIAKPRDGYNSQGVRAGGDCTADEWREVLLEMAATGGTVQEYVEPWSSPNVEGGRAGEGLACTPYRYMEGLYLFGGRFAGVFTRCGSARVIGEHTGRLNMGCLVAD